MYLPDSLWTWAFTLIALCQGLAVVALEGYTFYRFQGALVPGAATDTTSLAPPLYPGLPFVYRFVYTRTVPTFLALYIFAVIYQFILTIDALRMRNIIQVIGLCGLNVLLLAYGSVQTVQIKEAVSQLGPEIDATVYQTLRPTSNAVVGIFAAGTVLLSLVAWKLYQEFAWTIYKSISADLRMKRRYLLYQVYLAILKFDFFFFLGYSVQWIVVLQAIHQSDAEFPITVAAVPVTIIILLLAAFAVRHENLTGTFFVLLFYFAGLAYFIFKVVRIWSGDKRAYYQAIANPLTTFAAIDVALTVVTIGVCIKCAMNFKKGLREHVTGGRLRKGEIEDGGKKYSRNEMATFSYQGGAPVPSRMTIE